MNEQIKHSFLKMSSDMDDHIKSKDSYLYGSNGRVFVKDGTLSFTSLNGTEEIYNNPKISKYLGASVFKDQVVIFAKCTGMDVNVGGIIYETNQIDVLLSKNFTVDLIAGAHAFTNEFSQNSLETTYTQNLATPAPPTEVDFQDNYATTNGTNEQIDYNTYYNTTINVPNFDNAGCPTSVLAVPPNNAQYSDCIITLQYNDQGVLFDKVIWSGYQNWPVNGKILAIGIEENANYKRVKYTDNVNPFRSINVYDPNLFKRSEKELANFQSTTLLQPRVLAIEETGSLNSMAVQYYYRLITENGQVTEFSPPSEVTFIYPSNNNVFRGGKVEESTNKSVKFECNVVDPDNFNEIEVVAAEYEGSGLPTSIRSLGIQAVAHVNTFYHYGSEPSFGDNVTIQDLLETKVNWKYCSDLDTKNNKLFAAGLRNDPLTSDFNVLKYNFALHGWLPGGSTHSTFMNPEPWRYNMIPVGFEDNLFYVSKRLYSAIKIFQNATVSFENTATGDKLSMSVVNDDNFYVNHLEDISVWLLDQQDTNPNFATYYPNLTVEFTDNVILLKPIDGNLKTDFTNYKFTFDIQQVIDDYEDEVIFNDAQAVGFPMVHGAMSAGFNSGNGIRLTFRLVEEELATQATSRYNGSGKIIDFKTPNFKKTYIKGEIYRLGINFYRNGERLFVVPCGDLKIPDIGDAYTYIDDNNNPVISTDTYVNQKVIGNKLYGVRVEIRAEVRLDCNLSKNIDMYQLLYVERTEENRTILAQGISAPLMRVQNPVRFLETGVWSLNESLKAKWMLPYHGGPTYDDQGLEEFDIRGDVENDTYKANERSLHDRSLFYFDSPDLIYGAVSDALVASSRIQVLGRLNTDHTKNIIMESGDVTATNSGENFNLGATYGTEVYPKFSRKIPAQYLNTITGVHDDMPFHTGDERRDKHTVQSHFVNVSVFSEFTQYSANAPIDKAISMLPGQIIPGGELGTSFDLSNNAMCLPSMPWWYADSVREIGEGDDQHKYEAMLASTVSKGQRTMFIKSIGQVFTPQLIGLPNIPPVSSQIRIGSTASATLYDSHGLLNIQRENRVSVYGGRTELAFSKNVYIPLSETKPVNKNDNSASVFNVEGDGYVSLYIRTKNTKEDAEEFESPGNGKRELNNGRGGPGNEQIGDLGKVYILGGAWCYAAVLETMIEPKLNPEYEFYRESSAIDFYLPKTEQINNAYSKRNNAKSYIPQPFRFKDDPLMTNIVAASETKLSGDYYDAWTNFMVNEFQELDKNKGAIFNLVKFKDELFAIQERQTNVLHVDRDVMIPADGANINLKQGAGKSIDGYKVISKYGTAIRRAIVQNDEYGFSFIDETLKMLIKVDKPITIQTQYHHDFFNSLRADPILDIEAYFDEEHQESCFQIKQVSGASRVLSYNEVLRSLNGFYEYDAPMYIQFQDKLLAPIENEFTVNNVLIKDSSSLHQLNTGIPLKFFGSNKKMVISFVSALGIDIVTIFKHISFITGNDTTIEKIELETKAGLKRTILATHLRYRVREGIHSVPLLNYWTDGISADELKDLRSEYVKVTVTFPFTGNTQKIVSSTLDVRKSLI